MKRIVVTAPQLTDIVARELDGCEIIGGDHAMTREELAEQIVEADALLSSLSDPLDADMLARAKAELRERTGGRPYACPIPGEVLPPPLRQQRG